MRRRAIHGLHLLLITALLALIAWNRIRSGEYLLFKNLSNTLNQAQTPIAGYNKLRMVDIRESVEAYPGPNALDFFRRAIALKGQCDSAIGPAQYRHNSLAVIGQNLPKLYDTLAAYVDHEPVILEHFNVSLLQSGKNTRINNLRTSQQQMLWNVLATNVQLAKLETLRYINAKIGVGTGCFFSAPIFRQTDVLCPQAGQSFRTTVFLSSYDEPQVKWYPLRDKIWVNEEQIISSGRDDGEFTITFPTPGPHPLHLRVEKWDLLTDSVRVYEKTYTVNVQ